jgi:crotonobetaine/carnitine-CoA ligase
VTIHGRNHWGPRESWTLPAQLERQARTRGDSPFLQVEGQASRTFGEVMQESRQFAARLASLGVGRGDRVLLMMPSSETAVYAWFGASLAGAVDVPLNLAYRGNTLVHGINLAAARVIVTSPEYLGRVAQVEDRLGALETVVVTGEPELVPPFTRLRMVTLADVPLAARPPDPAPLTDRDVASVVYTSGTTGPAKGVLIPHGQAYSYAWQSVDGFQMTADDVFYCFHPLFHTGGKGAVYCSLLAGCQVVLRTGFDPATWIDDIRRYQATLTIGHGPMLEMVFAQPERPDDADTPLRAFMACPFPTAIAADFERRFGAKGIEVYGMTEVGTPVWRPLDEPLRLGSAGKPLDDLFEVAIVDPQTDELLRPGEPGEITLRPKLPWIIMQGYLSMPDATVHAWRNLRFHTGDVGYLDTEGYLYFVDRAGDRIRRKAENISSYEIEVAACAYPPVREAAAIAVASGYVSDDEVKLCVVADQAIDFQAFLKHLVHTLPHYMVPRYIEQIDALPRTPTNKVRKQQLRDKGNGPGTWDRASAGISLRELSAAGD